MHVFVFGAYWMAEMKVKLILISDTTKNANTAYCLLSHMQTAYSILLTMYFTVRQPQPQVIRYKNKAETTEIESKSNHAPDNDFCIESSIRRAWNGAQSNIVQCRPSSKAIRNYAGSNILLHNSHHNFVLHTVRTIYLTFGCCQLAVRFGILRQNQIAIKI